MRPTKAMPVRFSGGAAAGWMMAAGETLFDVQLVVALVGFVLASATGVLPFADAEDVGCPLLA
jgi:hypothetical protein